MKEELLKKMIAITDEVVESCKSDFYTYDLHSLSATETPAFFWSVRKGGTSLLKVEPQKQLEELRTNEHCRFTFMQNKLAYVDYFMAFDSVKTYHYHNNVLEEISNPKSEVRKVCEPIYEKIWHTLYKEFGKKEAKYWNAKVPVSFATKRIARMVWKKLHEDAGDQLLNILGRFHRYTRTAVNEKVIVYPDFGDNNFVFTHYCNEEIRLNGGVLFYNSGWHMHT